MKAYLDVIETRRLEAAAQGRRDKLLIRLLAKSGCRVSEALSLEVTDIDAAARTVTIRHLKSRIRLLCPQCGSRLGSGYSFCPKCGAEVREAVRKELEHRRMRTLPIDRDTLQLLLAYIDSEGGVCKNGKRLIFGINRHRAWQIVKRCGDVAALPRLINPETGRIHGVSPHRLRDAFAVHAVRTDDSGDGLRLLQEHLGHTSFNTTARYRKVAGSELQGWYDRLWQNEEAGHGA